MTHVFLALPHNGMSCPQAFPGQKIPSAKVRVTDAGKPSSNLCANFNDLWVYCLNNRFQQGYTHFAMMHADVSAPQGWVDTMLSEMGAADIISAVIAIKDARGLTTTAVRTAEGQARRLTLREIWGQPLDTFDAAAFGESVLLVNTGLWLCKLGDWCEDFPGFEIVTRVEKTDAGMVATTGTEDWLASLWWHAAGLKVKATRKVAVEHWGLASWGNQEPWGTWERDLG